MGIVTKYWETPHVSGCCLIRRMQNKIDLETDAESFSALVQKECSLNKKMSERLAGIFLSLYSKDNEDEWENKRLAGMNQCFSLGQQTLYRESSYEEILKFGIEVKVSSEDCLAKCVAVTRGKDTYF